MSYFECLPIGTAARLADLETEVERLRAALQALRNEIYIADIGDWDLIDRIDAALIKEKNHG